MPELSDMLGCPPGRHARQQCMLNRGSLSRLNLIRNMSCFPWDLFTYYGQTSKLNLQERYKQNYWTTTWSTVLE
jgi:hypothetical protein